jgi:hypothetical protein
LVTFPRAHSDHPFFIPDIWQKRPVSWVYLNLGTVIVSFIQKYLLSVFKRFHTSVVPEIRGEDQGSVLTWGPLVLMGWKSSGKSSHEQVGADELWSRLSMGTTRC